MKSKRGPIIVGLAFAIIAIIWLAIPSSTSNLAIHAIKIAFGKINPFSRSSHPDALKDSCLKQGIDFPPKDVNIVVKKSEYKLYLYSGKKLIKTYPVSLGNNPVDDKTKEGDGCTPEGEFFICDKSNKPSKLFLGSRWMRLSYPNKEDAERGLKSGLINHATADEINTAIDQKKTPPQSTSLGGGVGIHGGAYDRFGKMDQTWTAGCIALYDQDIEGFYDYIGVGARVVVKR